MYLIQNRFCKFCKYNYCFVFIPREELEKLYKALSDELAAKSPINIQIIVKHFSFEHNQNICHSLHGQSGEMTIFHALLRGFAKIYEPSIYYKLNSLSGEFDPFSINRQWSQ